MSSFARPLASSSRLALRARSTSSTAAPVLTAPKIAAYNPKRDPTTYGIPAGIPRQHWPKKADTDTSAHPLWRFFHKKESLEVPDRSADNSGRSWTSFELRKKAFEELHTLWYVCLRERNVLYTQREEARRLRVDLAGFTSVPDKIRMLQKTMARIKQVISERRHAAADAGIILQARELDEAVRKMELEEGTK